MGAEASPATHKAQEALLLHSCMKARSWKPPTSAVLTTPSKYLVV